MLLIDIAPYPDVLSSAIGEIIFLKFRGGYSIGAKINERIYNTGVITLTTNNYGVLLDMLRLAYHRSTHRAKEPSVQQKIFEISREELPACNEPLGKYESRRQSIHRLTCSRNSVSFSQALPGENSPAATTETSTPRGRISWRKQAAKLSTAACVAHCMPRTGAGTLLRPSSSAYNMQKQKKVCKQIAKAFLTQLVLFSSIYLPDVKNTMRPFALRIKGNINCVKRATPSRLRNNQHDAAIFIYQNIGISIISRNLTLSTVRLCEASE
uniref:Uncharacterized protein n=1 Tax=Glossina palpalis gambiensis TaxID=67801 RepID=A0A1B0BUD5_9MUSC